PASEVSPPESRVVGPVRRGASASRPCPARRGRAPHGPNGAGREQPVRAVLLHRPRCRSRAGVDAWRSPDRPPHPDPGRRRWYARPGDGATGTGGVLARYAAEGVGTVLVTCTDGGCGDGPGGVKPGDPGHDPAAVAAMRRRELEASCDVLGVGELEMLGYADSGMMGWPSNDAPGSFWRTPVEEGAARLADLMRHYRPEDRKSPRLNS